MLILPCDSSTADPPANSLVSLCLGGEFGFRLFHHKDTKITDGRATATDRQFRGARAASPMLTAAPKAHPRADSGSRLFFQQLLVHLLLACGRRSAKRRAGV